MLLAMHRQDDLDDEDAVFKVNSQSQSFNFELEHSFDGGKHVCSEMQNEDMMCVLSLDQCFNSWAVFFTRIGGIQL